MEATWYALQVRPRYENSCEAQLTSKGYEVFCPRYVCRNTHRGQQKLTRQPLFPGYLFCRLTENSVGKMVVTSGAIRLLGVGNRPEPVADHEIESLRRIDDSEVDRQPWRYLPGGSMVKIESGPLAGVCGVLLTQGSARRIVVSVTLLHRSVSAELEENTALRPLGTQGSEWKSQASAGSYNTSSEAEILLDADSDRSAQTKQRLGRAILISNAS
jgi:transcriptional antiterminator RfaH